MKVLVGALGIIPSTWGKRLREFDIRGKTETFHITSSFILARKLR